MAFDCLEYFQDNIEKAKPSANGNFTGVCPSCGVYGGFYCQLYVDHDAHGNFICYKCEFKSKSFVNLIMMVENCSYADALKMFRKREMVFMRRKETPMTLRAMIEGVRAPAEELTGAIWDEPVSKTHADLPGEFKSVWNLSRKKWRVPQYLTDRGFKRLTLRKWNVGFCESGTYEGRIIVPLKCPNGTSFTARDATGENFPKYLNPPGVDHSLLLFGWHTVSAGADFALVEGPLDALKLDQWGIPALAFGGKSLSNAQMKLIFSYPESTSVTVMLDPDAITNAYKIADLLKIRFSKVFVAKIPATDDEGNKLDPGASTREQAHEWFYGAKEHTGGRTDRTLASLGESLQKAKNRFG